MFRAIISPILRSKDCVYSFWYNAPTILPAGNLDEVEHLIQAASSVHYTTSCKHSLEVLRMDEIFARNILSWLELLINRYCCVELVVYIIVLYGDIHLLVIHRKHLFEL
jgi:hypothetical protein